jgi:hypothetical protein
MSKHNFSDYESSDTLSRFSDVQNQTSCFSLQGESLEVTEKPKSIMTQTGRTIVFAPVLTLFQKQKSRRNKLNYFQREYDRMKVRDLVNTL